MVTGLTVLGNGAFDIAFVVAAALIWSPLRPHARQSVHYFWTPTAVYVLQAPRLRVDCLRADNCVVTGLTVFWRLCFQYSVRGRCDLYLGLFARPLVRQ